MEIDLLLHAAGWHVCNVSSVNLQAARGVAVREFPLNTGHEFADWLPFVNWATGLPQATKGA